MPGLAGADQRGTCSPSRTPTSGASGHWASRAAPGPGGWRTSPHAGGRDRRTARERRGRGHPGRPDGGRVLVGQHSCPQGRGPQPRSGGPPRPQPLAVPRPDRRRRALHADAVVLGRRLELHARGRDARRRDAGVRGAVRARGHAGAHRAGTGHPGARVAAHGPGAHRPPQLRAARPVLGAGRHARRAAAAQRTRPSRPPGRTRWA